jgi:hypothetical protein
MARTRTTIAGIEELRRRLKATPRIARALLADRIVRPTATDTAARAVGLVPVDEGDLARAITVEGRGLRYRVGLEGGPAGGRTGSASHQAPAIYGAWVEYGSVTHGPRPFMRPAAEYGGRLLEARTRTVAADLASEVSRA